MPLTHLPSDPRIHAYVAKHAQQCLILMNAEGLIQWVNPAFYILTGYTAEEASGHTFGSILHGPDTDPETVSLMGAAFNRGEAFSGELIHYTKLKRPYWCRVDVTPLFAEDGSIDHFISMQCDITKERELHRGLQAALVNVPGFIFILCQRRHQHVYFSFLSHNAEEMLGFPRKSLMADAQPVLDQIHWDDLPQVMDALSPGKNTSFDYEIRYLNPITGTRWLRVSATPIRESLDATTWCGNFLDVTTQRNTARALLEQSTRFSAVSRFIPGVIFQLSFDAQGHAALLYLSKNITPFNRSTLDAFQYDALPLLRYVHPDDAPTLLSTLHAAYQACAELEVDFRYIHTSAGIRWARTNATPQRLNDTIIWTGYANDITTRRELETQQLQDSRRDAIQRLAGGVAHDFNNYLASILGTVEALQLTNTDDASHSLICDLIGDIQKAKTAAKQLLVFTQDQPITLEPIPLRSFLDTVLPFALRGSSIRTTLNIDPSATILADHNCLQQIFFNLALNSRQAMNNHGMIEISLCPKPPPPDALCLLFHDTGPGISPAIIDRVFDPYFTTRADGSGIGLHVVRMLTQRMHGTISLNQTNTTGTTFLITLPLAPKRAPSPLSARPPFLRPSARTPSAVAPSTVTPLISPTDTVLHLEDDPRQQAILHRFLGEYPITIHTFSDGDPLLHAAANLPRSLSVSCILDVMIANGSGGLDIVSPLRTLLPHATIVLVSGFSDQWHTSQGMLSSLNVHFLSKPYLIKDLLRFIDLPAPHVPHSPRSPLPLK
jgi:PAS domain S-box-containing protein